MIKQNGYLENLLVFQNSLSPDQCLFKYMDRVNWTEWGCFFFFFFFWKLHVTGFQGSHFVYEGEGGMLVGVCESKYVGVLMRFEW